MEPNVAAGLAYLLGLIGGIIMLVGGGTNRFVKWSACQSLTLSLTYIALWIVLGIIGAVLHFLIPLLAFAYMIIGLLFLIGWLWTWVMAFQGKEVRLPVIADLTQQFFGSQLA